MVKRNIIKINENKCNGCGICIPNCPEGAIQIIDNKARLVSDLFCDGLGACIGHCPEGAIKIEKRDAEPYDEIKVMKNIVKHGENTIRAHLEHLQEHNETEYLSQAISFLRRNNIKVRKIEEKKPEPISEGCAGSCPGSAVREVKKVSKAKKGKASKQESVLAQWPVQLDLLPTSAPFFRDADLLVAADCVPFAYANFHSDLLEGKGLVIGCPKLDDVGEYEEKLTMILKENNIKSVTVAIMEVPCCHGMYVAVENAIEASGKKIPLIKEVITVSGDK